MPILLLLLIISLLLSACQTSPILPDPASSASTHSASALIWADDDSAVVFSQAVAADNNLQQLFIADFENPQQTLGAAYAHQLQSLHFMKKRAYVLRHSKSKQGRHFFDKINMKGHELTIMEIQPLLKACETQALNPMQMLPSLNGRYLAFIHTPACGFIQIDFIKARNLTTVKTETLETDHHLTALWTTAGLVLADPTEQLAWRFSHQQATSEIDYPTCLTPASNSTALSSHGERAFLDPQGSLQVEVIDPATNQNNCLSPTQ